MNPTYLPLNFFDHYFYKSMKNKLISSLLLASVLGTGFIQSSCMGKFVLLKQLYSWNNGATGDKHLDNVLFWILSFVQVYTLVVIVDAVIFNLVEFWTGANPMAMNEGDRIEKMMHNGDEKFLAIATKNKMEIKFGEADTRNFSIVYQVDTKSWMLETKGKSICMAKELDNNQVALIQAGGNTTVANKNFSAKKLLGSASQFCLTGN